MCVKIRKRNWELTDNENLPTEILGNIETITTIMAKYNFY